jgi:DNA repair exonuclease SbcCD ATPase subunit
MFANEWDAQTLMLVGNHEQVTLGGLVHGLTPLAAAAPDKIHVFDGPAMYAGALWLPYRRDPNEIVAALESATTKESLPLGAIFAHVDVQGASLNDACQARDGVPPSIFPKGVPVYTGHYHKPHTVANTSIRYVGSPYQVSRAEAGQEKALLVVDSNWKVVEEIALDIGPRHFDLSSFSSISNGSNESSTNSSSIESSSSGSDDVEELAAQISLINLPELLLPKDLRRGDRIRVALRPEEIKQQNKTLRKLASQGISVELVTVQTPSAAPRITAAENLGPEELFQKYAAMRGLHTRAITRGEELLSQISRQLGGSSYQHRTQRQVSLSFSAVELEGYFSFIQPQRYELQDRGLVVVTGQIQTAAGEASKPADGAAESNGAGKTALVMAPLWALTGDVDARSELGSGRGLTNSDIVNEDSKFARVKLQGTVDGIPFTVERRVVRRGRGGGLTFELDGVDKTTQDVRLTQAEIDAALGTALLGRAAFYGQSEITALLESSDRSFKEELGKIVDLDIWADAKEASRKALAKIKTTSSEVSKELEVKEHYVEQQRAETETLETQQRAAMEEMEGRRARGKEKLLFVEREMRGSRNKLENILSKATAWLDQEAPSSMEENNSNEESLRDVALTEHLKELETNLADARKALAEAQVEQGGAQATAAAKQRQLEDHLQFDHQFDYHQLNQKDVVCDRCLQPISAHQAAATTEILSEEHDAASVAASDAMNKTREAAQRVQFAAEAVQGAREQQMAMMRAAAAAKAAKAEAEQIVNAVKNGVFDGRNALNSVDEVMQRIYTALKTREENLSSSSFALGDTAKEESVVATTTKNDPQELVHALRCAIQACTASKTTATSALANFLATQAEQSPLEDEINRRKEWLARETQGISQLKEQYSTLCSEIEDLKAIDEAFKPTGIVSFVLEGALGALQQSANQNLSQLAPGISLELAASRPRSGKSSSSDDSVIEQVEKKVLISIPGSTEVRQRSVRQLSGGERRRVALALALGFTELAARRGRLRCDLLVLDEVMQHLDGEGCARLASLLRGLDQFGTVLVVAQAQSFMTRAFDGVDVVVRGENNGSSILVN